MHEAGYKVVAISDIHGGIYNPNGLDIPAALNYLTKHKTFERFPDAEQVSNHELLEIDCDVLAARRDRESDHEPERRTHQVQDPGRRAPTARRRRRPTRYLIAKGIFVIPDILANAGGVTFSYFEWVQDRMGYFWKEEVVNERLAGHDGRELQRRGQVRREPQRQHPHRRLHAGD